MKSEQVLDLVRIAGVRVESAMGQGTPARQDEGEPTPKTGIHPWGPSDALIPSGHNWLTDRTPQLYPVTMLVFE
jgi:hypothetical protein